MTCLSPQELESRLRDIGRALYHDQHPFHKLLHSGQLDREQLQAWALNRFEYQRHIPIKDAILLARMDDSALRRRWRQRLEDHDGTADDEGGIARWLGMTDALGLSRALVESGQAVLPGTRFAVQAYVQFVRERPLLEGIASSLTELFAPGIIQERLDGLLDHYKFIPAPALGYFNKRLTQAPEDARFALDYVLSRARSTEQQRAVQQALRFKCSVLWAQLDALYLAYVSPGMPPPGAFRWDVLVRESA